MTGRRNNSSAFKAKVVLGAVRKKITSAGFSKKHGGIYCWRVFAGKYREATQIGARKQTETFDMQDDPRLTNGGARLIICTLPTGRRLAQSPSIRIGQAGYSFHFRPSRINTFAMAMSLRRTAVMRD